MPSFDIVSKCDLHEVDNAVEQARKEINQRFDFKDTRTEIEKTADGSLLLKSTTEDRLKAALDVLQTRLVKRNVSLKFLDVGKLEGSGQNVRQTLKIKQGIADEPAKKIQRLVKDSKIKVQASIQGDTVRVTGKQRDDLQSVMALLRGQDLGIELQFTNFRD
ncbi:MAG: YajQ family cyclic di-GMP-binding protein [Myxococcota bacterium]